MSDFRRIVRLLWIVGLVAFVVMGATRVGIFEGRIAREMFEKPEPYYPNIVDCLYKPQNEEELIIWQYRTLGMQCEK